jgi:hypothetical protein
MKENRPIAIKPRNPLVAAARFRRAGAHTPRGVSRQAARMRLRKEMQDMKELP